LTGCDTGFGNLLTKKLDGLGFHVFAGCLSEKGMKQLESETSSNVTSVKLDVTKTESIQSALQVVKSKLPKLFGQQISEPSITTSNKYASVTIVTDGL
jgi:NADP-dependent 3-hydroxy acid dehydrogenase YdfG